MWPTRPLRPFASRRRSRSRRSWRSVCLARPMRSSILAASEQRVRRTSRLHIRPPCLAGYTRRKQRGIAVNLEIDARGCNIISSLRVLFYISKKTRMLLGISFYGGLRRAGRTESPRPRHTSTAGPRRRTHHRHPAAAGTPLHISTCHMHMHIHVIHVHVHAHACDISACSSNPRPAAPWPSLSVSLLTGSRPPGLRPGLHPRTRSFERPNGTHFPKYRDSWVWTVHVDGSDGPRLVTTTRGGQGHRPLASRGGAPI